MAFKMKAGKEGPMYKNFPGAFKAVEGEETTKRLKTGGTVTINSPTSKTYDSQATINKLIDAGMTREEAEAEVKLSMQASSHNRTTGDE